MIDLREGRAGGFYSPQAVPLPYFCKNGGHEDARSIDDETDGSPGEIPRRTKQQLFDGVGPTFWTLEVRTMLLANNDWTGCVPRIASVNGLRH